MVKQNEIQQKRTASRQNLNNEPTKRIKLTLITTKPDTTKINATIRQSKEKQVNTTKNTQQKTTNTYKNNKKKQKTNKQPNNPTNRTTPGPNANEHGRNNQKNICRISTRRNKTR